MPSTDAADSSETSVGLSWETGDAESLDDTGVSLTSGDTNDVAHLVLGENLVDEDVLLKFGADEFDLLSDGAAVDLNLHEVSSLLSKVQFAWLSVHKGSNNRAVVHDPVNAQLQLSLILARIHLSIF